MARHRSVRDRLDRFHLDRLRLDRFDRPNGDRLPVVTLVTVAIAALAWAAIVGRWLPMPGGAMGGQAAGAGMQMADPGVPEAAALAGGPSGIVLYLSVWGVMMVAMMYPSSAAFFRLYSRAIDGATTAGKAARLGAVMGTYGAVWTAIGVVPLVVNWVVPVASLPDADGSLLVGTALLLLGAYQLSPYKHQCLRKCQSPLGFLMTHYRPGVRGAVRMSWSYSAYCVGCCWALFGFMVVVGSMNVLWMALLTLVLTLERAVAWGDRLASATGILAALGGSALVVVALL